MRFLVELNSFTASTFADFTSPPGAKPRSSPAAPERCWKAQPNCAAVSTSVSSSGLSASKSPSVFLVTVCATASTRQNALNFSARPESLRQAARISSRLFAEKPFSFVTSPNSFPPTATFFRSMMFCVTVPVLSEKMYCTCPSSWQRFVARARAGRASPSTSSFIFSSNPIART